MTKQNPYKLCPTCHPEGAGPIIELPCQTCGITFEEYHQNVDKRREELLLESGFLPKKWISKEEPKKHWPDNMGKTFAEFGTSQKVSFANVTMIDTEGKEHEIPKCEKCGNYKQFIAGKEAFSWHCDCDYSINLVCNSPPDDEKRERKAIFPSQTIPTKPMPSFNYTLEGKVYRTDITGSNTYSVKSPECKNIRKTPIGFVAEVDFPFGPIPHWIKCFDQLPPHDSDRELLIFNRWRESANADLKERTFVWTAKSFKQNAGSLNLNYSYTWWMFVPEYPND